MEFEVCGESARRIAHPAPATPATPSGAPTGLRRQRLRALPCLILALLGACRSLSSPPLREPPEESPVLSPAEALGSFHLPPGYRMELVAAEPLVQDPVAVDIGPDGRMYVAEMRGYMPTIEGEGEERPVGRIVVLEDVDDDGRMDRSTVYLDSLVLPRAVRVLEHGVLVAAPPYLWLTRDTDGDLRADTREVVRDDYGNPNSNPELNASGLLWGMDNWLHSAKYDWRLRWRKGGWEAGPVPHRGQWGVAMDDYGRTYRTFNELPLQVDLVSPHYLARNPSLRRTRGVYEDIVENDSVWPVRKTPGVNRGYRETVLRADSTLAKFTAAGGPVVYRGDRLPRELRSNVFVTEPAGNLVRRFVLREHRDGTLSARNAYERAEFLASTDERFRPVNLYSAPDGTLYVVDMYRGLIQHREYLTDYLEQHIRRRRLQKPLGMGRIYRVVHESTRRAARPRLSGASSAELVRHLSHPNGWWRDMAQRLLVERGDRSAAPALRRLALGAVDERTRLHALWTLEGLAAVDRPTLEAALADRSPHLRAAAIRIAEPDLAGADDTLRPVVAEARSDSSPAVRRQLTASAGEFPRGKREAVYVDLLRRYGDDPVIVDLVASGLHGREAEFLDRLLAEGPLRGDAVPVLVAAVMKAGDAAVIERMFHRVGDESRPRWQRSALLAGIDSFLPEPVEGSFRPFRLSRKPDGLLSAAAGGDPEVRTRAAKLLHRMEWPGKPIDPDRHRPRPLTDEEQQRFAVGRQLYLTICAGCHQPTGAGLPGVAAALTGSSWVLGEPSRLTRILLHGKEGAMLMPAVGATLRDEEAAAILTYIRREWGHEASPVDPEFVREIRGQTTGRERPWTEEELSRIRR